MTSRPAFFGLTRSHELFEFIRAKDAANPSLHVLLSNRQFYV